MREFSDTTDSFVTAQMAKQRIPGLAVAVIDAGRLVFAEGYGFANVAHARRVTKDTVFPILSVTKTFTATAVMMLVEQGRLSLEDPLKEYLPTTPDTWRGISVRHLISHMSGLTDVYNDLPEEEWPKASQREAYIHFIARRPLKFPPGERQSYCNTNFTFLGWIVEAVSGRHFKQHMHETIFHPLQMEVNPYSGPAKEFASGYLWEESAWKLTDVGICENLDDEDAWNFGNGGFVSTLSDMAKWDAALGSERLLKQSTLDQMWTPARQGDGTPGWGGLGWGVNEEGGKKWVAHAGSSNGFRAEFGRNLTDRITLIAFANLGGGFRGLGEIAGEIGQLYLAAKRY